MIVAFVLNTDVLGGQDFNFTENTIEDRGRSISIDWTQSGANQDLELYGYSIRFFPSEEEAKEVV